MLDCTCLIHPFQNDPGTSQRQRTMEDLLAGAAKIDARTLADLLDYFVQLSGHINYYGFDLNTKDWQPFFKKSIPFALAAMIKYPVQHVESNFELYKSIFEKKPTAAGLQLNSYFIFYRFIKTINDWHKVLVGSNLPIVQVIEELIKNKLQQPVKWFIRYANAAVKAYGIKRINFTELSANAIWGIDLADIYAIDTSFSTGTKSKFKKLHDLNEEFSALVPILSNAVKIISKEAEQNIEKSFIPLKEELQQQHQPQLALIFAFLNLFRQLQDDLNKYTRKHLDYFYKDILKFKSAEAIADKAHVIFEIQKQLESYLLKKGLKVKDGKDDNKQQILFALDDDIVVTKTTIADERTLFLNNKNLDARTYVEGVYMAPAAAMADGVEKEFKDDPKNFPTVGDKYSKYQDPETKLFKPYPNARLGFILASPVLFLQEGSTRTVEITLACELEKTICGAIGDGIVTASKNCCDGFNPPGAAVETNRYPEFYPADGFYDYVNAILQDTYYYINQDLLKEAVKKGISSKLADQLKKLFLTDETAPLCYCPAEKLKYETTETDATYHNKLNSLPVKLTALEQQIVDELIKPRKALNLLFSGDKSWIEPSTIDTLEVLPNVSPLTGLNANQFQLHIKATLNPDKAAVTFYDKEKLKEDFGTTDPVVKIELDDKIKFTNVAFDKMPKALPVKEKCCVQDEHCCLLVDEPKDNVSLYHFFRNVLVSKIADADKDKPIITVDVCGLKNFIVQNDESVMDVNGPMMAFGARPKVNSNFYIGSEEIFLKKWRDIYVNINWKDLPTDFEKYYVAYQTRLMGNPPDNVVKKDKFKVEIAILQDGNWIPWKNNFICDELAGQKYNLFQPFVALPGFVCTDHPTFTHQYSISHTNDFTSLAYPTEKKTFRGYKKLDVLSRDSFIKITLRCQDFQHTIYPFVLARQMMAFGKLPKETVDGAVYYDPVSPNPIVFSSDDIKNDLGSADTIADRIALDVDDSVGPNGGLAQHAGIAGDILSAGGDADRIRTILYPNSIAFPGGQDLIGDSAQMKMLINKVNGEIANIAKYAAIIPNEPWTPMISNMNLNYEAIATSEDITLIHLYPYQNTYRQQELASNPTLFPTFCDEGTLFLGLKDLVPGDNLNILFQLAEATSDSEADKEEVYWYYLDSNVWKPLRNGFEVLDDATKNLTTSGIVKLAMPSNMTTDNTVMPKNLYWIKATIAKNSKAVSEAVSIIPQAMLAIFTNENANDKARLAKPLPAGGISKLNEADANIKSVAQPFASFGGAVPEIENQFYVRVSETLRHKGRAIQAFDYERLALQAFPELYKVKCINHSFALNAHEYSNDFPYAPGYVMLAVIPDLNKLNAGNSFEPKVPVSIIEDIELFMRTRTSPFVRFRAMNPRYEKINFCLRVRLMKGKDENYFREKIKQDIKEFMAPWAVGVYDKLTFGQCVYRSDIIGLLEKSGYVDFIADFQMGKENTKPDNNALKVCPATPRSILIAGDIEVCIEKPGCETWSKTYTQCENGKPVLPCSNKPELIMNYCK